MKISIYITVYFLNFEAWNKRKAKFQQFIAYSRLHTIFASLVQSPSWKRRIIGSSVDAGIGWFNPNLVAFAEPNCDGRSALLISFSAIRFVKRAPIYHQICIPIITAAERKAPVKDVQSWRWGGKAVVACAECAANICL